MVSLAHFQHTARHESEAEQVPIELLQPPGRNEAPRSSPNNSNVFGVFPSKYLEKPAGLEREILQLRTKKGTRVYWTRRLFVQNFAW